MNARARARWRSRRPTRWRVAGGSARYRWSSSLRRVTVLPALDFSSLAPTLVFAGIGAAVSAVVGGALGAVAGTLEVPGRSGRWACLRRSSPRLPRSGGLA